MKVFIGSDHGGVNLKRTVCEHLDSLGADVCDLGTHDTSSCDYPDYAFKVGKSVAENRGSLGIVICRSGVGMSICANKVKGVRCAQCFTAEMGRLCREHNNANCIALGADIVDKKTALDIVDAFISAEFTGGRHASRVDKISMYEDGNG